MKSNVSVVSDPQEAARIYVEGLRQLFPQLSARLRGALKFHLDLYPNQTDKEEWMVEAKRSFETKIRQVYPLIETNDWPAWPTAESLSGAPDAAFAPENNEKQSDARQDSAERSIVGDNRSPSAASPPPADSAPANPPADAAAPTLPVHQAFWAKIDQQRAQQREHQGLDAEVASSHSSSHSSVSANPPAETDASTLPVHQAFWAKIDQQRLDAEAASSHSSASANPPVEIAAPMLSVREELWAKVEQQNAKAQADAEPEIEEEPEEIWPHHDNLGDLLARIEDQSAVLNQAAHRLAALLHGGLDLEQAEQCRAHWRAARAQLDALWSEMEALTATVGTGQMIAMPRDTALDEELIRMVTLLREHGAARELTLASCPKTLRFTLTNLRERAGNGVREGDLEAWIDDWRVHHVEDAAGLRADLATLRESLEELCARPLEDELEAIFAEFKSNAQGEIGDENDSDERRRQMFFQRMGWNGKGKRTLSDMGEQWNISRERVRQIVGKVEEWVSEQRFFTPVLERALEIVGANLPARADDLALTLQRQNATRELWSLQALAATARSLGRTPEFVFAVLPDLEAEQPPVLVWETERFAGEVANADLVERLWQKSYRYVWECGIGYLPDLQDEIADAEGDKAWELAEILLRSHPAVRWSAQETDWFWLEGAREMHNQQNRLFTPLERALSVARRLSLPRLYAAATRFYLHSQRAHRPLRIPSQAVFEEWCAGQGRFVIAEGTVEMPDVPQWSDLLENAEATLVGILDEHGPLLSRWKFYQLALENGISKPTFYRYVDELSTIEEFDEGLFALVGAEIGAAQIQAAREDYSNFRRRFYLRYGRLDDGRVWMSHRLSAGGINSGSLNLPAPMRGSIEGRYQLMTPQIAFVGTLAFNHSQCWGLGNYLANHAAARDRATIILDSTQLHAVIYLGIADLPAEIAREVAGVDDEAGDEDED